MSGPVDMPGGHLLWIQTILLWAAFGMAAVLAGAIFVQWYVSDRTKQAFSGRVLVAYLALGFFALGLRLFISPHTILHENAHGYEYLRAAFQLEGYPYHGSAYYAFFHMICSIFGRQPEVIFFSNALLGTTATLLLVPLGKRLFGKPQAGWIAALAYACWPAALRISASESMFPLAIFFGLVSWLVWLGAWDTGRTLRFLLAAVLAACAVQVRPVMALWPAVLLMSLTLCRGWTASLRRPGPWLGLGLFLFLVSAWMLFRIDIFQHEGVPGLLVLSPVGYLSALFSENNILWRIEWTPAAVWLFSAAGLVALFISHRRTLPSLVVGFLALGWLVVGVVSDESSSLRLQSPMHPLVLLMAGLGVAAMAEQLKSRDRTRFLVVAGILLLFSSALRFPSIRRSFNPQVEYAFLKHTVPDLPQNCAVITADRHMAGNKIATEFPFWWMRAGPVDQTSRFLAKSQQFSDYPCLLFYRGLSCYYFVNDDMGMVNDDGIRPECRQLERDFSLQPHVEKSFASRPYTSFHVPAKFITIGFYRME